MGSAPNDAQPRFQHCYPGQRTARRRLFCATLPAWGRCTNLTCRSERRPSEHSKFGLCGAHVQRSHCFTCLQIFQCSNGSNHRNFIPYRKCLTFPLPSLHLSLRFAISALTPFWVGDQLIAVGHTATSAIFRRHDHFAFLRPMCCE